MDEKWSKEVKDEIENLSPRKFKVLELLADNCKRSDIAREIDYAYSNLNDEVITDLEDRILVKAGDDIESLDELDTSLFDALEPRKSDLAMVAEQVLESEEEYMRLANANYLRKRLEESYNFKTNNTSVGKNLRSIAAYVDMNRSEYLENFKGYQNTSNWNLSFIRNKYSNKVNEIIEENTERFQVDDSNLGKNNSRSPDVRNNLAKSAQNNNYEEVEISNMEPENIYKAFTQFDGSIKKFNQILISKSDESNLYQISKITDNNGGWAVDAINPSEVETNSPKIIEQYAILKRKKKGLMSTYEVVEKIDTEDISLQIIEPDSK